MARVHHRPTVITPASIQHEERAKLSPEDKLLTQAECADALATCPTVVAKLVQNEGLPEIRLGNRTPRYYWPQVRDWAMARALAKAVGEDSPPDDG